MAENTATIWVRHLGEDRLGISVRGHELFADQPVGEGGKDSGPHPHRALPGQRGRVRRLLCRAVLRRHGLSTEGLVVACDYVWARDPARVGEIDVRVEAPGLPPHRYEAFTRVVQRCPIHNTLGQPPQVRFKALSARTMSAA